MNRSYLFVPADSERKLQRATSVGADAVILDLEDSVAAASRPDARALAAGHIPNFREAWVRVNPLTSDDIMPDLQAVMPAGPAGIVLPKVSSGDDLRVLSRFLHDLEEAHGITAGQTRVNKHRAAGRTLQYAYLRWCDCPAIGDRMGSRRSFGSAGCHGEPGRGRQLAAAL